VTPDHVRAHRHCTRHRDEVMASDICGCFHCGAMFAPAEISTWTDRWEGLGQTAVCPNCSVDAVIGSESGYPITADFLNLMRKHWF
jgi:hypothetical protein